VARVGLAQALFATIVVMATVVPVNVESVRWWHNDRVMAQLRLTLQQQQAIDHIYHSTLGERAACVARVARARLQLNQLLMSDADERQVMDAAVEAADADAASGRARTWMLFRILRVLEAEQRARMPALQEDDALDGS
jgi:hypothetical protein